MELTEVCRAVGRRGHFVVFALAFVAAVALGRATRIEGSELALVWPAAGVGLLWTSWAWRSRGELTATVLAVLVLAALGNGLTGAAWPVAIALGVANVVQAAVGAGVLHRFAPDGPHVLASPQGLGALALACLGGAATSSLIGPVAVAVATDGTFGALGGAWMVRISVSMFVVAAAGLRLAPSAVVRDRAPGRRAWETPLVLLSLTVAYGAVFGLGDGLPVAFLVLPFSVWVGLRFSTTAAAVHTLVAGACVVISTLVGRGPFAELPVDQRGVVAESMIAVVALVTLVLALKRDQRDALADQLHAVARGAADQAALLEVVVSSISDGIVVVDDAGRVIVSNPAARQMLAGTGLIGSAAGEWTATLDPRHPDGTVFAEHELPVMRALAGADVGDIDMVMSGPDGDRRVFSVTARPLRATDPLLPGAPASGAVAALRDVTQRRHDAERLELSERRFRTAFETAPVGMAIVGAADGTVRRANDDLAAFAGVVTIDDLVGRSLRDLVVADDRSELDEALMSLRARAVEQVRTELRFGDPGAPAWGSVSLALLEAESEDDEPTVVALVEDVTASKRAEDALTHQALHDQLTDLPNRALLLDRLGAVIEATDERGHAAGLMYLDLDGFKEVNDTYGHAAGDELLVELARRLEALVRGTDTVARLGGDEFAILCPDLAGEGELDAVAARVLAAVSEPMRLSVGQVVIRASVGVVRVLGATDAETLLRSADEAMYEAKRGGRDQVVSLSAPEQARASRAAKLLPELALALDRGELTMVGQPVLSACDGSVTAVEALVRWRHPTRGVLAPAHFLDVLETSALMGRAWEQILDLSLANAAQWPGRDGTTPSVHVNVSGRQLTGDLGDGVLDALERHRVDPGRLVLELTETFVPLIHDSVRDEIDRLRRHGVRIALDDLGTGYSSMAMLTELPIDVLKIDRRFVAGLGTDPRCEAVVHSIVTLGQRLDMEVVAEGVETRAQHDVLAQMECPSVQGYLYSRPIEQPALRRFLTASQATAHLGPGAALA